MKDAEVVDSDYYEKGTIVQRVGKALVCLGGDAGTTVEWPTGEDVQGGGYAIAKVGLVSIFFSLFSPTCSVMLHVGVA